MGLLNLSGLLVNWLVGLGTFAAVATVGVLKWLGQEESTDLAGESLNRYPRAVIRIDADRTINAFNDAAARWAYEELGVDLREYVGNSTQSLLPKGVQNWPDNSSEEARLTFIEGEDGNTDLVALPTEVGWYIEIHQQASTAPEVKRVRSFYEEVLDQLPVELALLSPSGEYLYANQTLGGAKEVREWLVGKTDFDYFGKLSISPELALRRRSQRREVLQQEKPVSFTEQIPLRDGPVYYRRMYVPIFGGGYEVQAIAFVGLDVTRQKMHAEEAARGREQFTRFSRLKFSLLQNLSHEFRTPIASMISAAEVVSNEAKPELREFAEIIEQNGHRLIHTLQNISQLVRLEEDGIELEPVPVDLAKKARNMVQEYKQHADRKGLYLKVKSERNELFAQADEEALQQVVYALIDNAIKFTDEGGVLVEIAPRNGYATLQVMDTGIGMDDEFLSNLFEPFEQASKGLSRSYQGTGIGLHLVHEMVNLMGGEVRVSTEPGEGSTFTVMLPLPLGAPGEQPEVAMLHVGDEKAAIMEHVMGKYVQVVQAQSAADASKADVVITGSDRILKALPQEVPVLYVGANLSKHVPDRPIRTAEPPYVQRKMLHHLTELLPDGIAHAKG